MRNRRWSDRWLVTSAIVQVFFGAYFSIGLSGMRLANSPHIVFGALPPLLFFLGYRKQWRPLMWICVAHYAAWLTVELMNWWHWSSAFPDARAMVNITFLSAVVLTSTAGLIVLERLDPTCGPFPWWIFR